MHRAYIVASFILLAGPLVISGCGQKKVTECNNLIKVINTGVQSLEKGTKAAEDPSGVVELKAMADAMDKVAADAAKVELTIPELQKYSQDYQTMAKEVATVAREMATAADEKDPAKVSAAQERMEKAVKQEDPLVDSINKFCQEP
jgi:hypothetical protein